MSDELTPSGADPADDDVEASTEPATDADDEASTEPATDAENEADTEAEVEADTELADDEAPPAADPEGTVDEDAEAERPESNSGTPDVPPPVRDERVSPEGLAQTTTTGDPAKDFRGPSVTEEARSGMEDEPALDEPGYADLGHAEDYGTLRRD